MLLPLLSYSGRFDCVNENPSLFLLCVASTPIFFSLVPQGNETKGLVLSRPFLSLSSLSNMLVSLSKSDGLESLKCSGACDGWQGGQSEVMPWRGTVQGTGGGAAGWGSLPREQGCGSH